MFFVRPQHQSQLKTGLSEDKNKLVCKICRVPVSDHKYLFAINNKTPYHTFYNPGQIRFDIMTLTYCQFVFDASPPSLEFTWFAGYAWVILCCTTCYEHLGWRFENNEKQPAQFFAMIQSKLETGRA
ncbi:MAG: hypothetical protein HQM14_17710 [SAR324 cluster bacterium]|nr:hypothetical protein [SAR324 cluster bacterium]